MSGWRCLPPTVRRVATGPLRKLTDIEDGDHDVQNAGGSPVSVAAFAHTHSFAGTTGSGSSLPPYTDMVWIMRVK